MAALIRNTDGKKVEVPDGTKVMDAAEQLNVTFRCRGGGCGACKTRVVEGMENLNSLSKNERWFDETKGLENDERLMCQAEITEGEVIIEPQEPEYNNLGQLTAPKILRRHPCCHDKGIQDEAA